MVSVNSTDNLAAVIGDPFLPFNWTISNRPFISLPHKDEVDKGFYISAALVKMLIKIYCNMEVFMCVIVQVLQGVLLKISSIFH